MQNFQIFTMAWGSHYVQMFARSCFKSLNWPKNKAAIQGSTWNIYTKREHFEEFDKIFEGSGFQLNLYEIGESTRVAGCGFVKTQQCDAGVILLAGLRDQIARSLQEKKRCLFAPPDTIFGDGSVPNLLALGNVPHSCVAVAHPRVLPAIVEDMEYLGATRGSVDNANLVTLAMKHAHDSWKYGEIGHAKNNSFIGGIAWRQLGTGLYSVTHRLPTVYLADFTPQDFDFFWGQVSFGAWDHRWPAENLLRFERQRYVGSSDAAFIVEVTEWDKNVPPLPDQKFLNEIMLTENYDAYWNSHYHNGINRQTSVIFRGE